MLCEQRRGCNNPRHLDPWFHRDSPHSGCVWYLHRSASKSKCPTTKLCVSHPVVPPVRSLPFDMSWIFGVMWAQEGSQSCNWSSSSLPNTPPLKNGWNFPLILALKGFSFSFLPDHSDPCWLNDPTTRSLHSALLQAITHPPYLKCGSVMALWGRSTGGRQGRVGDGEGVWIYKWCYISSAHLFCTFQFCIVTKKHFLMGEDTLKSFLTFFFPSRIKLKYFRRTSKFSKIWLLPTLLAFT